MNVLEYLKNNLVFLDGGMGTLLQKRGLKVGELPEKWNLTHAKDIEEIHKEYYDAGANVVATNTFGANLLKYEERELEEIVKSAILNAKKAREKSVSGAPKWIALDVGPTGRMLKPYGDLDFERAVEIFATTVRLGVKYGADLVIIETMSDSYETKAALLATKENSTLPVFVSNAYSENERLLTGASPKTMVALLEGMGADVIGVNCSFGPSKLKPIVREYLDYASIPVLLKPNAGLPKVVNGETKYDVLPKEFAREVGELVREGVRVAGGCCGTTPEYVKALHDECKNIPIKEISPKNLTLISSYRDTVTIGEKPILVGERINPTGKPKFKEALKNGDVAYAVREGIQEEERGVDVLDVNVGVPGIDEGEMLTQVVKDLQAVVALPLQIDTSSYSAMERALRIYNGKAMINSVSGKEESMKMVFPLVKKYGGVVVALTIDENGIPSTAEERVALAEKIIERARDYGIDKKDIVIDPLALTIGADANAGNVTLRSLKLLSERGINTILGVSNVSYGLPNRDALNATFFSLCLQNGLKVGIVNPCSQDMMKSYNTYLALTGKDENFEKYIAFAQGVAEESVSAGVEVSLFDAITKGIDDGVEKKVKELLQTKDAVSIINEEIIPSLDKVGVAYEQGKAYLPNLLMSAEVAKKAFQTIKESMVSGGDNKGIFVLATVKGDIHDIGKNIVKMLLENYGFKVIDLGKDVPPETIVLEVVKTGAPLCGLSALMTTTVPSMEETIKQLRVSAPWCKICVGGAVLTEDYAEKIGADKYCKDAMETVRYALSVMER